MLDLRKGGKGGWTAGRDSVVKSMRNPEDIALLVRLGAGLLLCCELPRPEPLLVLHRQAFCCSQELIVSTISDTPLDMHPWSLSRMPSPAVPHAFAGTRSGLWSRAVRDPQSTIRQGGNVRRASAAL